jgi:hypothetical protein
MDGVDRLTQTSVDLQCESNGGVDCGEVRSSDVTDERPESFPIRRRRLHEQVRLVGRRLSVLRSAELPSETWAPRALGEWPPRRRTRRP